MVGHKPKVRGTKIDWILHIEIDLVRLQILYNFENFVFLLKKIHYRV